MASDAERLARFQREAEVLARLNHPQIAQIYGFEKSDTTSALVMELVEGLTLAERIAQGPIAVDEALPIAKQIAEALEAAHDQGIIHRDLKPANIKLRPDGSVKVLDFGLAKAIEGSGHARASGSDRSLANSPTITSPAMTQVGTILGTAAYMSPEQAKGRAVDRRTDVWAFSCVVYEMLTGRRAFAGDDVAEVLAALIKSEPDWSLLPADVSPALRLPATCRREGPALARSIRRRPPPGHRGGIRQPLGNARPTWNTGDTGVCVSTVGMGCGRSVRGSCADGRRTQATAESTTRSYDAIRHRPAARTRLLVLTVV
jgi:serine/threonine protein kinase